MISLNEAEWHILHQITMPGMVQIMTCRLFGTKPLYQPMLAYCELSNEIFFGVQMLPGKTILVVCNGDHPVLALCFNNLVTTNIHDSCSVTWWHHQMETFSAFLALCEGNSPVSGEFPAQSPVTRSFDVFFHLCLNKQLSKQSWGWWFEAPSHPLWRHSNDTMDYSVKESIHNIKLHHFQNDHDEIRINVCFKHITNHNITMTLHEHWSVISFFVQNKENISAPHFWSFVKEIHRSHWPFVKLNPPVTGGIPSQRDTIAKNVSMLWRHQEWTHWPDVVDGAGPGGPASPGGPWGPLGPLLPKPPDDPAAPILPVCGPVGPGGPACPVAPVFPGGPSGPCGINSQCNAVIMVNFLQMLIIRTS